MQIGDLARRQQLLGSAVDVLLVLGDDEIEIPVTEHAAQKEVALVLELRNLCGCQSHGVSDR